MEGDDVNAAAALVVVAVIATVWIVRPLWGLALVGLFLAAHVAIWAARELSQAASVLP